MRFPIFWRQAGVWVWGLAVLLVGSQMAGAAPLELSIAPPQVEIGTFFQGAEVKVQGEIPAGTQAVLEVLGQNAAEKLMRKGRRGGLWMNVGEIQVQGAPCLYLVMSTGSELLSSSPAASSPAWGYQALEKQLAFSGRIAASERPRFFQDFLKLKESEGLYGISPGALKVVGADASRQTVQGAFSLPAQVAPGIYRVCLSVLQEGRLLGRKCVPLQVVMVGFPAALSDLAYHHGALYGILAVIIAIFTGFLMGFLFKGKTAH